MAPISLETLAFWPSLTQQQRETLTRAARPAVWRPGEIIRGVDRDCLGVLLVREAATLPYDGDELAELGWAQSADVIFLAHRNHPPAKLSRHADDDWRYAVIDWLPSVAAPTITEAAAVGVIPNGENSRTDFSYVATAIDAVTGEESMPSAAVTVAHVAPLSQSYYIRIGVSGGEGTASEYRIYKKKGGVFGYIGRLPVDGAESVERVLRLDGAAFGDGTGAAMSGTFREAPGRYRCTVSVRYMPSLNGGTVRTLEANVGEDTAGYAVWRDDATGAMLIWAAEPAEGEGPPTGAWSWYVVGSSSSLTGTFAVRETDWGWADGAPRTGGASLREEARGGSFFEDRNFAADTEDTPPNARNPFGEKGRYPAVVFLHQQRLGFAASDSQPMSVWLSQAGNYESMAASIPPADDDAIEATLAAPQANRILWCESDRGGLALGTEGGEWILTGADGGAVTPSSLSFQPQTFYGSQAGLPMLRTGQGLVFLQRGGRVMREYGYSFSSDRYESGDLSLLARHILREDVCETVTRIEREGAYFVNEGNGHRLGAWRPRQVTFWAEYSPATDGAGFVLHAAWCHRMRVPGILTTDGPSGGSACCGGCGDEEEQGGLA